jgi:hypothetical protein
MQDGGAKGQAIIATHAAIKPLTVKPAKAVSWKLIG